jgi:hypothetical protein
MGGNMCVIHRPESAVTPKREILPPWYGRITLAKALQLIESKDLSEWGYMSEHWQGKSKFYLRMKYSGGATQYRVSESTYDIIKDQYDWARDALRTV